MFSYLKERKENRQQKFLSFQMYRIFSSKVKRKKQK